MRFKGKLREVSNVKTIKALCFSLCFGILASCGFHLRGMLDMPPWLNDIDIIVQTAHRDLGPMLKEQLEAYHIRVCDNPNAAKYWLIIEQDIEKQNIVSISSSTTPRQYQMFYTVRFKLQTANGKEIIPTKSVTETREITVNSDRILGSNDEEAILKSEMRKGAVLQIISRISKGVP